MLPTFVIGLREGLEAALIVGIVAGFLANRGRRDALRQVWIGVGTALVLCLGVGITLEVISQDLPQKQQEGLETVIGMIAVAMVTYMVLWMRHHSRDLKGQLEHAASDALAKGSTRALVVMAFLGVLREGFETAVFLLATFQHSDRPALAGTGAASGIVVAVAAGYLIYRGGLRINLSRFFRVTGAVLVFIAAGIVMFAFHTAHEAGWITFGQSEAADLSSFVRPGTVVASLVTGVLGFQPRPTQIELAVWFLYLVPMMALVLWPAARRRPTEKPGGAPDEGERERTRSTTVGAASLAVVALLAGCSSSSTKRTGKSGGEATQVQVALTSGGCAPSPSSVSAGPVTFAVANESAAAVTEAELTDASGKKILGEKENIAPGLNGSFSLTLAAGSYLLVCPGAKQSKWPFTVTAGQAVSDWHRNTDLTTAVDRYETYVREQVAGLVATTSRLASSVKAGNLPLAKTRYALARRFYERIEPVAETFSDLDARIDGRADDAATPAAFTGFHRIEKALWVDKDLAGMGPIADRLVADLGRLEANVAKASYSPAELARGATELIDEIQSSKITGEEERYSRLDLVDFAGNLEGAEKVVRLLTPALRQSGPELVSSINQRVADVRTELAKYASTPGYESSGFVDYGTVTRSQRRSLATSVNALGAEVSTFTTKVTA